MARYLITGGAGFIGSHLTDLLLSLNHEVIIFDDLSVGSNLNNSAELIKGSICNISDLRTAFKGIDGCFHLAAVPSVVASLVTWHKNHEINLEGSINVFKAAIKEGNVPVVYASSCAVYGNCTDMPLNEELFIQPISSYGCDKLASEHNAFYCARSFGLPITCLRFFNVYGPRQNPNSPYSGVISKFINAANHSTNPIIYDDGTQTRDFVYVDDVVNCLMLAMKRITTDAVVMNICTSSSTSVLTLANSIASLMDKEISIEFQPRRIFDVQHSLGSNKKIKDFGYNSFKSLNEGLHETIKSMKNN